MGAQNAMAYFKRGVLLITPGDREDIILAACTGLDANSPDKMAGIVLTGNLRPNPSVLKVIRAIVLRAGASIGSCTWRTEAGR